MPKKPFFNLTNEKKTRIINASYDAFLEKPYEKVSILDITTKADIPVGSFYQYFKDKDDLYIYLIIEIEMRIWNKYKDENENALFDWFEYVVGEHLTEKEKAFENTWCTVPPLVMQKFYFGEYYSFLKDKFYKNKFYKLYENGKIKDGIDSELALYLFITSTFNVYMYCRSQNITDQNEIMKIKQLYVTQIFPYGILNSDNSK